MKNEERAAADKHERTRKKGKNTFVKFGVFSWLILSGIFFASCAQKMGDQPTHKPFAANPVLPNKQLAQPPVFGTVPSRFSRNNQIAAANEDFDANSNELPFPLTETVLNRGRERFEANCAMCHGFSGYGDGMVVKRGFSPPPSYHEERLRNVPLGHFYDVITNGYGAMGSYRNQVEQRDRWAIAAYIRALQLSQNASVADVPPEKLNELEKGN